MILKTRESHRIPLSVMDSIIYDVQSLFEVALCRLNREVAKLQTSVISQEVVESVDSIFTNFPQVFEGLQTQQQQLSFFRRNFNFIVSTYRMKNNNSITCAIIALSANNSYQLMWQYIYIIIPYIIIYNVHWI